MFDMELGDESLFEKYRLQHIFDEDIKLRKLTESLFGDISTSDSAFQTPINKICSFACAPFNMARMLMGDLSVKDDFYKLYSEVGEGDAFVVVGAIHGYTGSAAIFSLGNTLNLHFRKMIKAAVLILPPQVIPAHENWENDEMVVVAKEMLSFFNSGCFLEDKFNFVYQSDAVLEATMAIVDVIRKTESNAHGSKSLEVCLTRFSQAMENVAGEKKTSLELLQFADLFFRWKESMKKEISHNK